MQTFLHVQVNTKRFEKVIGHLVWYKVAAAAAAAAAAASATVGSAVHPSFLVFFLHKNKQQNRRRRVRMYYVRSFLNVSSGNYKHSHLTF